MGLTIAGTAAALNRYQTQFSPQITQKFRQGLVLESLMTPVVCDHSYTSRVATVSDAIQPFQSAFTPKGDVVMGEVTSSLQPMKVDIQFTGDQLADLFDKYHTEWVLTGRSLVDDMTWARFIYEEVYMPKIIEELELTISWKGVYAAPLAGTAGATIASCDGLKTVIDAAITATKVTPIAVGIFDAATAYADVETFGDGLPEAVRYMPGKILTSPLRAAAIARDKRNKYGTGTGNGTTADPYKVEEINKEVVGVPAMVGDNRLLFSPGDNLIVGFRRNTPQYPTMRWQEFDRTLKGLAEFHRFYSVKHWENVFISD